MTDIYQSTLLVGGKGMLAHMVAQALQRRGRSFVAVDLPEYDITQPQCVQTLFADYRPTLVLNCSAHTKVDLCEEEEDKANAINGYAVGALARTAREFGSKLFHLSTDFVFDGKGTRPYRPDDPPCPLSAYGRSKLLGEQLLQQANPPGWIIARTAWLYGPRGLSFPRTMVERARAGQPLRVVDDQVGSPTYTRDLAEAMLDLVDCDASGIFHVTNSGQTNWYEFAKATLEEFGLQTDLAPISTAEYVKMRAKSAIRPAYSVLDGTAFARTVDHLMRPWRQGLREFRDQVQANGGL